MIKRKFKPFGEISALTLGGGGIGNVWGSTTRKEAVATVNLAIDKGINHFDVAPMYGKGEAEKVLGLALKNKNLDGLHFTTKCLLGTLPETEVYNYLNASLTRSLQTMGIEKVNLFLLHSQLIEDEYELYRFNEHRERTSTTLSIYFNAVIPAFETLKQEGKIDSWGIGLGQEEALIRAINHETPPEAMQCVVNLLNSAGAIGYVSENFNPYAILTECQKKDIPILAIRAVQAGALTSSMDRELESTDADQIDFIRALPFRVLAEEWGESPASLAHRYALSAPKVSSVILGVKNRIELEECITAEKSGNLTTEEVGTIENLFLSK